MPRGFEAEAVNPKVDGSSPKKGIAVLSDESGGAKAFTCVIGQYLAYDLHDYYGIFS